MNTSVLGDCLLGPFGDARRMALGALADVGLARPPRTRRRSDNDLGAARATLTRAGCRLVGLTCENLHTATVALPVEKVYATFRNWEAWPRSGFLARPGVRGDGTPLFSYRFWGLIPVVRMHLFSDEAPCTNSAPCHIIYAVDWGFGHGGYHTFLFEPAGSANRTQASIFTVYPPQPFPTGLHDQTNRDIFRKLEALSRGH